MFWIPHWSWQCSLALKRCFLSILCDTNAVAIASCSLCPKGPHCKRGHPLAKAISFSSLTWVEQLPVSHLLLSLSNTAHVKVLSPVSRFILMCGSRRTAICPSLTQFSLSGVNTSKPYSNVVKHSSHLVGRHQEIAGVHKKAGFLRKKKKKKDLTHTVKSSRRQVS